MHSFIVENGQEGKRIDTFLAERLENISRNAIINLIDDGQISVNDKSVKKNYKVKPLDCICVTVPKPKELLAKPQDISLDIVYEDQDVIVINKGKSMVVHPAPGNEDGTLVNALLAYCKDELSGIGGVIRPGIVHRIDKDTTGLLIVAKNDIAHKSLSAQLKDRSLSRTYYAMVIGNLKSDEGIINAPIGRSLKDRKKMAVIQNGREAVTRYSVIERFLGYTLVKCSLETGRTHQIRVHMAYIGHPIVGDKVYGLKSDKSGLDSQCLHAKRLRFIHPKTGETVELECPLPEYFEAFIKKLKPLE